MKKVYVVCCSLFLLGMAGVLFAQVMPTLPPIMANPCHILSSYNPVPAGFGAAYDVFSSTRDVLIKVGCTSGDVTVTVGKDSPQQVVYTQGYKWMASQNRWVAVKFNGTPYAGSQGWLASNGSAIIPSTQIESNVNYIVAYICTALNNQWRCGCSEASCSQGKWQLQKFATPGSICNPPVECVAPSAGCSYQGGSSCSCGTLVCSTPSPSPTPAGQGILSITPSDFPLSPGDTVHVQAAYRPYPSTCGEAGCPGPGPVEAIWFSTDSTVAKIISQPTVNCPNGVGGGGVTCYGPANSVSIQGVTQGGTNINAIYSLGEGSILNASANVRVVPIPSITVVSPNGGEIVGSGSLLTIKWSTKNFPAGASVNIVLFRATDPSVPATYKWSSVIVPNTTNDGIEAWTIPNLTAATDYYVSIQCPSSANLFPNGCKADRSDAPFGIITPISPAY